MTVSIDLISRIAAEKGKLQRGLPDQASSRFACRPINQAYTCPQGSVSFRFRVKAATGRSTGNYHGTVLCFLATRWTYIFPSQVLQYFSFSAVVIASGSGDCGLNQIYQPWYCSAIQRPAISSCPATIYYGKSFIATSPQAATVHYARLIRPGSSTHSRDCSQRYVELEVRHPANPDNLKISAPANANIAPPGWYMLFIANGADGSTPSIARWVKLTTLATE